MFGLSHVTLSLALPFTVAMNVAIWLARRVVDVGVMVIETAAEVQHVRVMSVVVLETPLPPPLSQVTCGVYVKLNPPPQPPLASIQSVTVPVREAGSQPDAWSHHARHGGLLGITTPPFRTR